MTTPSWLANQGFELPSAVSSFIKFGMPGGEDHQREGDSTVHIGSAGFAAGQYIFGNLERLVTIGWLLFVLTAGDMILLEVFLRFAVGICEWQIKKCLTRKFLVTFI